MSLKITVSPGDRTLVITAATPADGNPQRLVVSANAIFPLAEALQNAAVQLDLSDPPAYAKNRARNWMTGRVSR